MASATVEQLHPPGQPIEGCLDAIADGKVHGWTWDPETPAERLTVELCLDGAVVASGLADRPRADLAGSGIGDGTYAFAIDLPQGSEPERLVVQVRSPGGAKIATLSKRPQPQLSELPDELQRVNATVHGLTLVQKQTTNTMVGLLREMRESQSVGLEAKLAEIASGQEMIQKRLDSVEIFLLRFDTLLRQFDEKLSAPASKPQRVLALSTAAIVFIVAAVVTTTIVML